MTDDVGDELDPLPTADAASALQRDSFKALHALLPSHQYILREERADDYGVDASLEIIVDGRATNMRSHLQIKGRSATTEDKSGAIRVSIRTSNLNYLLNAICPIYVLYRPEANELRYTYARSAWARVESEDPSWRSQKHISIYFSEVLNSETLDTLRSATITSSRLARAAFETVTRLASAVSTQPSEPDALNITTEPKALAIALLNDRGLALVNAGNAEIVIDKARLIPDETLRQSPRALIALAYALCSRGRYVEANAHVRHALAASPSSIGAEDQSFARHLLDSTEYVTGRITREEFLQHSSYWYVDAPAGLRAQFELILAWELYCSALLSTVASSIEAAERRLRQALDAARQPGIAAGQNQIELITLLLDLHTVISPYIETVLFATQPAFPWDLRFPNQAKDEAVAARARDWHVWRARVYALSDSCRQRGDEFMFCDARLLACAGSVQFERNKILLGVIDGDTPEKISLSLRSEIQELVTLAQKLDSSERELRALLEMSDVEDTDGMQTLLLLSRPT